MPDWFYLYEHLTFAEKAYLGSRPWDIPKIKRAADVAEAKSRELFPEESLDDGPGDAFRRAYVSAMLARDLGVSEAYLYADLHEGRPGNPYDRKTRNLSNDHQGIQGYVDLGKAKPTSDELVNVCLRLLYDGKLTMAHDDPGLYPRWRVAG
jgi:hypothetical protein